MGLKPQIMKFNQEEENKRLNENLDNYIENSILQNGVITTTLFYIIITALIIMLILLDFFGRLNP